MAPFREFSKRHGYLARLWQSRYRARVIDSQDYFRQAVSYVHLNPVEAKIVIDPADYEHCGHGEILGLDEPRLTDVSAVLSGFDDGVAGNLRERYLSWIMQIAELRWIDRGIRELPWWKDSAWVHGCQMGWVPRIALLHCLPRGDGLERPLPYRRNNPKSGMQ